MGERQPFSVTLRPKCLVETYPVRKQQKIDGKAVDVFGSVTLVGRKKDPTAHSWKLYNEWLAGDLIARSGLKLRALLLEWNTRDVRGNISASELKLTAGHIKNHLIPAAGDDDVQKITTE